MSAKRRRGTRCGRVVYDILADWVTKNKPGLIKRMLLSTVPGDNGCVLWTRRREPNGYAKMSVRWHGSRINLYTHHVWWTLINQRPIPDGMEVHHTCGNALCIKHLGLLTPKENMQEMNGRKNGQKA